MNSRIAEKIAVGVVFAVVLTFVVGILVVGLDIWGSR